MSVHACKTVNPRWANFVDDTKHVSTDDHTISVITSDKSAEQQHQGLLRCVTAFTWFPPSHTSSTFMSTFALGGCVTRAVRGGKAARPRIVSGHWEWRNRRDGKG